MQKSASNLKTASLESPGSDAMINEGGHILLDGGHEATTVPAGLADAQMSWPEVFGDALPTPHLILHPTVQREIPYRPWDRAAGKRLRDFMETDERRDRRVFGLLPRIDTHMNRVGGKAWWYWPAIAVMAAVAVSGFVYAVSASDLGAGIALMLKDLI